MKNLRVGLMGILIILMSNLMITRAEAATKTEDGYTYSTDGLMTSNTLFSEQRINKYEVVEKDIINSKSYEKTMLNYLVDSNTHYTIPGIYNTNVLGKNCDTMIPQGICRLNNYILITAYDYKGKYDSVIYVVNNSGILQATLVYNKKCHMGGIAYDGEYVWIAEGGEGNAKNGIGAINKSTILGAVKVAQTKNAKSVKINNIKWMQAKELKSTSFCTYFDNKVWFGTFDKNSTNDIYGYSINYQGSVPQIAASRYIEAPKKAQGMCFYKSSNTVYLGISTSYGRKNNSVIRCYKVKNYYNPTSRYKGVLQILKGNAYKTITLPPMLEQITVHGVFMYAIFESAAKPYVDGSDDNGKAKRIMTNYCILSAESIFK